MRVSFNCSSQTEKMLICSAKENKNQPNRFTNVQIKLLWAKNVGIYGADGGCWCIAWIDLFDDFFSRLHVDAQMQMCNQCATDENGDP